MDSVPHIPNRSIMTDTARIPDKPALEGLEAKWGGVWESDGTSAQKNETRPLLAGDESRVSLNLPLDSVSRAQLDQTPVAFVTVLCQIWTLESESSSHASARWT